MHEKIINLLTWLCLGTSPLFFLGILLESINNMRKTQKKKLE